MLNADRSVPKPPKSRRRWIVTSSFFLIALIGLILVLYWDTEPTYKGVKLRQWLTTNTFAEMDKALAEVGPESIPCLIRVLEGKNSAFTKLKIALWKQLPWSYKKKHLNFRPISAEEIRPKAAYGLALWGPEATEAAPMLIQRSRDTNSSSTLDSVLSALACLSKDSPEAVSALVPVLQDNDPTRRSMAAMAVWRAEPGNKALLPPLIDALKAYQPAASQAVKPVAEILALTHFGSAAREAVPFLALTLADPDLRFNSLMVLKSIGPEAKAAVPAIIELLKVNDEKLQNGVHRSDHASAIEALASMGPAAEAALPTLTNALQSKTPVVRLLAAFAIGKIEGKPEFALPALTEELRVKRWPDSSGYWMVRLSDTTLSFSPRQTAVWLLAEIGPPARIALPALTAASKRKEYWTPIAAARAIWRIEGRAELVLPTFVEALKSQYDTDRILAIAMLAEMGTEGRPAVPALLEARKVSLSTRRRVNEALKRIDPETAVRVRGR